jgi:hypothetical protein
LVVFLRAACLRLAPEHKPSPDRPYSRPVHILAIGNFLNPGPVASAWCPPRKSPFAAAAGTIILGAALGILFVALFVATSGKPYDDAMRQRVR